MAGKHDKYEVSTSIGKKLMDQVKEFEPDIIVCDSETCRWHITSLSGIDCVHPIELLARSLQTQL